MGSSRSRENRSVREWLASAVALCCVGYCGTLAASTVVPISGGYGTMEGGRVVSNDRRRGVVVLFEIDSATPIEDARVADFELFDATDTIIKARQIVSVETVTRIRQGAERECVAWHGNPADGLQPWSGNLPAGKTRVRVRVELESEPPQGSFMSYRLTVGELQVEGTLNCGRWPS